MNDRPPRILTVIVMLVGMGVALLALKPARSRST